MRWEKWGNLCVGWVCVWVFIAKIAAYKRLLWSDCCTYVCTLPAKKEKKNFGDYADAQMADVYSRRVMVLLFIYFQQWWPPGLYGSWTICLKSLGLLVKPTVRTTVAWK